MKKVYCSYFNFYGIYPLGFLIFLFALFAENNEFSDVGFSFFFLFLSIVLVIFSALSNFYFELTAQKLIVKNNIIFFFKTEFDIREISKLTIKEVFKRPARIEVHFTDGEKRDYPGLSGRKMEELIQEFSALKANNNR